MTEHSPCPNKPISSKPTGEGMRAFTLLGAADLIRAISYLIGCGFFSLILLIGMSIAIHLSTLQGGLMVMGLAVLMSAFIAFFTYYVAVKAGKFKEAVFEKQLCKTSHQK